MNTAEVELVLRNEIDQDQSFITLDLYSEEKPLGREDAGPQRITESQVTIGLPTINALPHSQHVDRGGWDYYSLYQPFTLHRLEGERNYQSLVFQVTVDNPSVIAADLFPKDVNVELHIENRLSVTSQLKFSCKNIVEVGAGAEIETKKGYINLIPIIIAYGEGEREFYWEYETWKEQPVFPGVKQAAVILRVPYGTTIVTGMVAYKAIIVETVLGGLLRRKEAKTGKYPIKWHLSSPSPSS